MIRDRLARAGQDGQAGFSLVELLVAMTVFALLMTMVSGTVISNARAVDNVKQLDDGNEEARLGLLRMERELRQAVSIDAADLFSTGPYAGAGYASSVTFSVDFDGDGTISPTSTDPERLTYRFSAGPGGDGQIQLTADDASGTATVRPILSGHVSDFHLELRSSLYACDTNGNGTTTWQELDTSTLAACPHPNNNGLDANELAELDGVYVAFTVYEGVHSQSYATLVNLRNVGLGATT